MSDDFKKDVENFLYSLIVYIIVKEILPKLQHKDENEQ